MVQWLVDAHSALVAGGRWQAGSCGTGRVFASLIAVVTKLLIRTAMLVVAWKPLVSGRYYS